MSISVDVKILSQLNQVLSAFQNHDENNALNKFSELPLYCKNKIYKKFWKEMGKPEIWDYGKLTFHLEGHFKEKLSAVRAVFKKFSTQQFLGKSLLEIEHEFDQIQTQSIQFTSTKEFDTVSNIGRKNENQPFNLWITPFNESLVTLNDGSYINANFAFDKRYILSQCPSETPGRFWQMVHEKEVKSIVMLNELHEYRIYPYWPEHFNKPLPYGDFSVTLTDYTETFVPAQKMGRPDPLLATRTFIVEKNGAKPREVVHFHYSNWQDGQAPDKNGISTLIKKVNLIQGKAQVPIVVHCSAGIGRTGCFTLLHKGMKNMEQGKKIDLFILLKYLRSPETGRSPYMVGTHQQYLFCHKFFNEIYKTSQSPLSIKRQLSNKVIQKPLDFQDRLKKIIFFFEQGQQEAALELFSNIPQAIRYLAYKSMYEKIGSPNNVPFNHGELCFQDVKYDCEQKISVIKEMLQTFF